MHGSAKCPTIQPLGNHFNQFASLYYLGAKKKAREIPSMATIVEDVAASESPSGK